MRKNTPTYFYDAAFCLLRSRSKWRKIRRKSPIYLQNIHLWLQMRNSQKVLSNKIYRLLSQWMPDNIYLSVFISVDITPSKLAIKWNTLFLKTELTEIPQQSSYLMWKVRIPFKNIRHRHSLLLLHLNVVLKVLSRKEI